MIASHNRRQARQWKSFFLAYAVSWAGLAGAADTASLGITFSNMDGVAATACDGQFTLELSFEPDPPGLDSDWWLVQLTPAGELFSFDLDSWNFEPGLSPSYQGPGIVLSQLPIEPECPLPVVDRPEVQRLGQPGAVLQIVLSQLQRAPKCRNSLRQIRLALAGIVHPLRQPDA